MELRGFDQMQIGDRLPPLTIEPITRTTLAAYAEASSDDNPIHLDPAVARAAGMDDVFAHGMLVMAYLGRALTMWLPQMALRRFSTRFVAISQLGDQLTCGGSVVETFEEAGERRARLELWVVNQHGDRKLSGEAVVALP
jgi:acyl dehydratase